MFENLNKLLRVDSRPLEEQKFVHISCNAGGNGVADPAFLTHHFIGYFLKRNYKVCRLQIHGEKLK